MRCKNIFILGKFYGLLPSSLLVALQLVFCSFIMTSYAQSNELEDIVLTEDAFLDLVIEGHPVMMQSGLLTEEARAKLRKARGEFDPEFYGNLNQKYFDDKTYYSLLQSGLKVPTWFGITLDAGLEDNRGVQLNPEGLTPEPELWHAGISIPIGQGLFIDKRRAELRKAQVFQEQNEAERRLLVNKILLEASMAYWDWYASYQSLSVINEALNNAQFRLEGVIERAARGDVPDIDTLEATIQVQNRLGSQLTGELELTNSRLFLETFLWNEGRVPLELSDQMVPFTDFNDDSFNASTGWNRAIDSLNISHPKLLSVRAKINMAGIDLRLKREYLKPKIDLKYNALSSSANRTELLQNYSLNNYNWGIKVSLPLFLRKERGEFKLAQIKRDELIFDSNNMAAQLLYKARAALNKLTNSGEQVQLYNATVNNYEILYDSEVTLFSIGESSLFLVNSREKSWLESRLKLIELEAKNFIAKAELKYHLALFN